MSRLPYVDPDDAPEHVAALLRGLPPLTVLRTVAHAEGAFGAWLSLSGAILNDLALDPILRELAILRVAALSPGAGYEWDQHEAIARQLGATEAQVAGARTGTGLSGVDELVVRFTEEVVRDVGVSDPTWALAAARFSPRELVELTMTIGQYMAVARIIATMRVDPDPPVGTGLMDALPSSARRP
jgi:4-carboxymuconolactone decarboxylase